MKHLEVRSIFNSLLSVSSGDETLRLMLASHTLLKAIKRETEQRRLSKRRDDGALERRGKRRGKGTSSICLLSSLLSSVQNADYQSW